MHKEYGFGAALEDLFQEDDDESYEDVEVYYKKDQWSFESVLRMGALTLHERGITHLEPGFNVQFPRCQSLALTNNHFTHWDQIFALLKLFPNLRSLNLSGNKLEPLHNDFNIEIRPNITELVLSNCGLDIQTVTTLYNFFPNLQTICIAKNNLQHAPISPSASHLVSLDVSSNPIGDFREYWHIGRQLRLVSLNISGCNVKQVTIPDEEDFFAELEVLNMANNPVNDWESINQLQKLPRLKNFRSSGLFAGDRGCQAHEMLIAKLPHLVVLDGCTVSLKDRSDAELYFLSKFAVLPVPDVHKNDVERLVKIYGAPASLLEQRTRDDQLDAVICYNDIKVKRKLPLNLEICKVVTSFARILKYDWKQVRVEMEIDTDRYESVSPRSREVLRAFDPKPGFRIRIIDDESAASGTA